jgi:hypothetical protein
MSHIWQTIRSYFWWTHERGSFHYDVMVTVILIFIFVGPRYIDFKDKPQERTNQSNGVTIKQLKSDEFTYQVEQVSLHLAPGVDPTDALKRWIEPFLGDVKVLDYKALMDNQGHITAYVVHVQKL